MFFWTEQRIRWYRQAAQFGTFHRELSARILPSLAAGESVCDLGCGLGFLSMQLAADGRRVTAVDLDGNALAVLREQQLPAVELLQADANALPPTRRWDTVILCFFGRLTENGNLDKYLSLCRRQLIVIVNDSTHSAISPTGRSRSGKERAADIRAFLETRGVAFRSETAELEFGQPLNSKADAIDYILDYSPDSTHAQAEKHVERMLEPLPDGRYYLPARKKLGIFTITHPLFKKSEATLGRFENSKNDCR